MNQYTTYPNITLEVIKMTNEKIDKRKKPTRRVTCPDCGTSYAVTSFKLHRCKSHDRVQWIKIEGNKDRYSDVLKESIEVDKTTSEELEELPNTIDNTVDENILPQENNNHIEKVKIDPEEKIMSEQPENPEPEKTNETTDEKKYECGECHYQFNTKVKYCPECGVSFA